MQISALRCQQGLTHALEPFQDRFPSFIDIHRQLAQGEQIPNPAHLVLGPAGFVELGAQTLVDKGMPAWNQRRLQARLFLQDDLLQPFTVIEIGTQQDVLEDGSAARRIAEMVALPRRNSFNTLSLDLSVVAVAVLP